MENAPKDIGQNNNSTAASTGQRKTEKEEVERERERAQTIAQMRDVRDQAHKKQQCRPAVSSGER